MGLFYIFLSVFLVSIVSFVGILFLSLQDKVLKRFLVLLISFSAGALLGDSFFHLIPESFGSGNPLVASTGVVFGILLFFVLEKFVHWQHCHSEIEGGSHVHSFAYMNLIGDGLHNFLDGAIIAVSYMVSLPAGLATTIAVLLHEIPQEIGDFGVLIHGGFSKSRALLFNFLSALLAVVGAGTVLVAREFFEMTEGFLVPIAAGGFLYIACSDLIPELHKNSKNLFASLMQFLAIILGVGVMALLLLIE